MLWEMRGVEVPFVDTALFIPKDGMAEGLRNPRKVSIFKLVKDLFKNITSTLYFNVLKMR